MTTRAKVAAAVGGLVGLAVGYFVGAFVITRTSQAEWTWPGTGSMTLITEAPWLIAFGVIAVLLWRSREMAQTKVAAAIGGLVGLTIGYYAGVLVAAAQQLQDWLNPMSKALITQLPWIVVFGIIWVVLWRLRGRGQA